MPQEQTTSLSRLTSQSRNHCIYWLSISTFSMSLSQWKLSKPGVCHRAAIEWSSGESLFLDNLNHIKEMNWNLSGMLPYCCCSETWTTCWSWNHAMLQFNKVARNWENPFDPSSRSSSGLNVFLLGGYRWIMLPLQLEDLRAVWIAIMCP